MRILSLEEFATIDFPETLDGDANKCQSSWEIVSLSNKSEGMIGFEMPKCSSFEVLIQNGKKFAQLNSQTLQISYLEQICKIAESCQAVVICPDGQTLFGIQSTGQFLALCSNSEEVKFIRPPVGMRLKGQENVYERIASSVKGLFGYFSSVTDITKVSVDPFYASLFPLLQSTSDGLAILCILKPEECFLYTCSYPRALRERHVSNIVGSNIPGRWWKIFFDDGAVICGWLAAKKSPRVEAKLIQSEENIGDVKGTIVYSALEGRQLEIFFGILGKMETRFELKWGCIIYEFDWISIRDERNKSRTPVGKMNHVTRLSSKTTHLAIAVNNYLGVYIYVHCFPGVKCNVKLNRILVPLCSHCDNENLIYYDEECWISCIEWLSEDCYFACITRCGCLSVFHKTGEIMLLKIRRNENPQHDLPCNFYYPIFNSKNTTTIQTIQSTEDEIEECPQTNGHPRLKWEQNVLSAFSGSRLVLFRIQRVSNYSEIQN